MHNPLTEQTRRRAVTLLVTATFVVAGALPLVGAALQEATEATPQATTQQPKDEAPAAEKPTATNEGAKEEKKEAEKEVKLQQVVVAEKRLEFAFPAEWKKRERRNNIIEVEFAVLEREPKEGEKVEEIPAGRLTLSSSGGTVDQNMRRWIGQFRLGHDSDGEDAVEQEVIEIEGATLHMLDISGTYFDSPRGPLGPKIERPDYRMLGAIIEIEDGPLYFVKFYGPEKLIEAHAKAFQTGVRGVKIHEPTEPAEGSTEASTE